MSGTKTNVGLVGGSGFIGTTLAKLLQDAGHHVRILDIANPPAASVSAEYRYSDVTKLPLLTKTLEGCDVIINLAAAHRDNVRPISLYHEVNVLGAENVCKAAETLGIEQIVFTSSVAVYGLPQGEPNEETAPHPFNPYGETKLGAEGVYRVWQERGRDRRRLEIVRPTVVFGPGNRGNVYNLLAQLRHWRFVMIGVGANRKSMCYVENVASFLKFMMEAGHAPGAYLFNYCDTPTYSMQELLRDVRGALGKPPEPFVRLPFWAGLTIGVSLDVVARLTGFTFPVSAVRVRKFCASTVYSSQRMQATGFKPPRSLKQALVSTIRFEFGSPDQQAVAGV